MLRAISRIQTQAHLLSKPTFNTLLSCLPRDSCCFLPALHSSSENVFFHPAASVMQWSGQKWNLHHCVRSVLSSRNLLLGLTDSLWRTLCVTALRGNNCLWFLLKRDHTPDYCTHTDTSTKKKSSICKFTVRTLMYTCSWLFSAFIEANQGFHKITQSFAKHFLGVWCDAWTCFHTPDHNGLNRIRILIASYKYNGEGRMTDCFSMQRSHPKELSLKTRRWVSASELEWGVKLRMKVGCQSSGLSAWLLLSQMTWNVTSILVLIKNKGRGEWEV